MPQVIYTGQGLRTPQIGDRALQALTQFGQQEQQRKTAELRQAFADRDKIAELMKIDPVYTTNLKANERIAKILDESVDKMVDINSKREGPVSAKDLSEMQRVRGEAMAEMQMIKGASEQLTQAYDLAARYPGKYNTRFIDDWREQWERSLDEGIGLPPSDPILIPNFDNPANRFAQYSSQYQRGAQYKPSGSPYQNNQGQWVTPMSRRYPMQTQYPEERVVQSYLSEPSESANLLGWFGQQYYDNPVLHEDYLNRAGGNEQRAARMWFEDNRPSVYPDDVYKQTRTGGGDFNLNIQNGRMYVNERYAASIQDNVSVGGDKLDKAIVFDPYEAKRHIIPIPKGEIEWPEGIESTSGDVYGSVYAADKDKIYWVVDKGSLSRVSFTENAMEAWGRSGALIEDKKTGKYIVREGADVNVVLPTGTNATKSHVDAWTEGGFSELLNQLPEKSEINYRLPDGRVLTKTALGLSDEDIQQALDEGLLEIVK